MAKLRQWNVVLYTELNRKGKIREQIVDFIRREINRDHLPAGTLMPSTRGLANSLRVNRNTIIQAYDELKSMQLLKTTIGKGTFVIKSFPSPIIELPREIIQPVSFSYNDFAHELYTEIPPGHWKMRFDDGFPDPRLAPGPKFISTYKRHVILNARQKKAEYNNNVSYHQLVAEIARMLRTRRGIVADEQHLCLMLSTRMALFLTARTLINPGDLIAVENPGDAFSWGAFRNAGAVVEAVEVDAQGLRTDLLENLCRTKGIKAVLIKPVSQYPTTVTMSEERRRKLIELAERYRFAIIQTDNNHEFCFDETATLPLPAGNVEGNVIYISNLSRMMAPLNLVACIAGPQGFITSLRSLYTTIYQRGDAILEQTVSDMLKSDVIGRHARRSQRVYKKKRDAAAILIDNYLRKWVNYQKPMAGLAFWLNFMPEIDVATIRANLTANDIWLPSSKLIAYSGVPPNALRIGFAAPSLKELERGISAIAGAIREVGF